ncbi:class F sortase [Serinicoccus kebangsaanensis]|uniref:class F sortase n=1 Tax=Serinicoccus kebangsaanensis TaxID=2602069 RepID=UPI00124DCF6B|nr:class F sortase [Serinicoccus kebangsaanensis]
MHRTQPRRGRIAPAAAAALLCSLAVVAVALWGLLGGGPTPAAADFGTPGAGVERRDAVPSPGVADAPAGATPTAAARAGAERPGTREASVEAAATDRGPRPVRLLAPELGLDVPLDAVGVTGAGLMEIPEDADRAGWYRHGPRPGDAEGSAVVAGHVDDRAGPGAFLALTRAEKGMTVSIVREDGSQLDYTVTARQTTDKKELRLDDLFDREGPPRLQLVTCTGAWSERAGSYSDNLVLTAVPAT